jgi:hypothetical protein
MEGWLRKGESEGERVRREERERMKGERTLVVVGTYSIGKERIVKGGQNFPLLVEYPTSVVKTVQLLIPSFRCTTYPTQVSPTPSRPRSTPILESERSSTTKTKIPRSTP